MSLIQEKIYWKKSYKILYKKLVFPLWKTYWKSVSFFIKKSLTYIQILIKSLGFFRSWNNMFFENIYTYI